MASSLPGAHSRLIASTAATRDQGTSAACSSRHSSKKRSNPRRRHSSHPNQQAPNWRMRSSRTRFTSTRATCGSSAGGSTCEGNSFNCSFSPCSLKTSTVFNQRACAEPLSSHRYHKVFCLSPSSVLKVSTSDQYVCSLPSLLRRFGRRNILTGCCHAHPVASRELVSTTLTFENPRLQGNILIRSEVQKSLESAQWRRTWARPIFSSQELQFPRW